MKEHRWLLPFTRRVDRHAINTVVLQAEAHGATLVVVSLLACSHKNQLPGRSLEHIEQGKDFFALVQSIAAQHQVPLECHDVFTPDMQKCLKLLIHDLHCDSIVVAMKERQGVFLHTHELTPVVLLPPASLMLIRLPGQQQGGQTVHLGMQLSPGSVCLATARKLADKSRTLLLWRVFLRSDLVGAIADERLSS